jgi:hypothetical protein
MMLPLALAALVPACTTDGSKPPLPPVLPLDLATYGPHDLAQGPMVDMAMATPAIDPRWKLLGAGAPLVTSVKQTDGAGLDATASMLGADGYVVTALVANTVPYTLVGEKPSGGIAKTYLTSIKQTDGAGLEAAASSLSSAGYLITAVASNSAPYTLVGVKESGATTIYASSVKQTDGTGLDSTASSMGAAGFAITAVATNSVPYTLVGVKDVGSHTAYLTKTAQTDGVGLYSAAASLGASGYAVTAIVANSVPYTLVGVKEMGESRTYASSVKQTDGVGLDGATASVASAGYVITTMTYNSAGYTLVGVR